MEGGSYGILYYKFIKTSKSSTIAQENLSGAAIISIKKASGFATPKAPKVSLYYLLCLTLVLLILYINQA